MVNIQEYANRNNAVTAYSPTRVLDRSRANAGTAQRILAQRAAPAQYQPRTQGFQMGGQAPTQQPAMPDTAAAMGVPPVRSLAEMLDHIGNPPAAPPKDERILGGFRDFLGTTVNNPVGRAIMAPLNALDIGRKVMVSGVNELADVFNGGDASFNDFIDQVNEGISFTDIIPHTGNPWIDKPLGFIGDVALDPLTYVFGAGILTGTGRSARLALSARVFELTGEQALAGRVAKYGLHALNDAKRAEIRALSTRAGGMFAEGAEKIKSAGYYFRAPFTRAEVRLPGTATIDRVIGGGFAHARSGVAASPLGSWFRNRRMEEGLVEAGNRLLGGNGGKSSLSMATALEVINVNQAFKLGKRFTAQSANAELVATLKDIPKGMTMSDYTELVERQGGQRGNVMMEKFAAMLEKAGIRHGRVAPETAGGVWYFPRYMTPQGKAWYTGIEESAGGNIFGAGHTLDDYSASLMTRHVTGGDIKIKDYTFHLPTHATTRDINTEFRNVTGSSFNLFEEDFDKAVARYIQNLAQDVGETVAAKRLVKSKGGMVRSYGDHEAVKEIVDDVRTSKLTEAEGQRLKEELNNLGTQMDEIRNEVAKNLRGISSGFLKPRFQGVIDDLTSLTAQHRQLLTDSLDQDIRFSALLGRNAYGAAPGSQPGFGTLDAALERIWNETAGEVDRLSRQRADGMRALALQHDQIVHDLATAPNRASIIEYPERMAARQRIAEAEADLLRLQQNRSSLESLHNLINEARIKSEAAGQLADDTGFLSLFLPGQAEARQAEVLAAREAAAPNARVATYDDPTLSTESITNRHNRARAAAFADQGADQQLMSQARTQVTEIQKRSEAFVKSRRDLEAHVATHSGALEGARLKLEADSQNLAILRMRRDDLIGIAEKRAEKDALEVQMREFELGQYAQSRADYDDLRQGLNTKRETAEADARSLAEAHNDLVAIAREIDAVTGRKAANSLDTRPVQPVHPPLPMDPNEAVAMRREHARLVAERGKFNTSVEGGKYLVLRTRLADAVREKEAAERYVAEQTGDLKDYMFNPDGTVQLRRSNDLRGYQLALDLEDAERQYKLVSQRAAAAESALRDAKLQGGKVPPAVTAKVRRLQKERLAAATKRDDLNTKLANFDKNHIVPNVELTKRQYDAIIQAGLRSKRMEAVAADLGSKLNTDYAGVAIREQKIESMGAKLTSFDRAFAEMRGREQAYRDALRAFENPQPAKTLPFTEGPFTEGQPLPWGPQGGMGDFERRVRELNQSESDELSRSARFLGFKTKWEEVPQLTDAEALGLRGLTADQRIAWNQASAIIRESGVFTDPERNPIVLNARQTLRDLRAEMKNGVGVTDQEAVNRLERMYDQLDELALARGAFDPTARQRKAIEAKIKLPGKIEEYEVRLASQLEAQRKGLGKRETARGVMGAREEAMRALDRGAGKKGKQNVSYEVADRARRAYRLARFMRDTHMPTLVERGALPAANRELGRVDVAEYITNSIATLGQSLERYGANPSSFAVNQLEQQASDVNRMAEFMVRYNRAIETGVEPSDSVAAYLLTVQLGRESELLGKQIDRATKALAKNPPSKMYKEWQDRFGTKLPEELQAAKLTGEQLDELRHLSKTIPIEDQIKTDEKLIAELDAKKLDGTWTSADKAKTTVAQNRIVRNRKALARLEAEAPETNGTINQVINRVVTEIEQQIHELDWATTDFNDARHMVRDAQSIGQHRVRLEAAIERGDGMLSEFENGMGRLRTGIAAAEGEGSGVVSYIPTVQDEFMMTVEQARNALDSGEMPQYLRPALQAAIDRAERGAEGVNITSIQRVREEAERLGSLTTLTGEQKVRLQSLRQRLTSFEARASDVDRAQYTIATIEAKLQQKVRLSAAEQRDLDAARRLVASDEQRAQRARLKPKRQRKVSNAAINAYAELHGVDPTHVISSRVLREGKDVAQIPIDEARRMVEVNEEALGYLRAAQLKRQMRLSALDGTINKDVRLQKAILADQMGGELPDPAKLQATINEINARARRRQSPGRRTYQPEQLSEAMAAAEREPTDILSSGKLFPHEKELVELTQGRLEAVNRFGRMTPQQLTDARNHLDELQKVIDDTRGMLGDHFDLAAATADQGTQFLSDLVGGHMELTANGVEALHMLYGPEAGEHVAVFIRAFHELLGVQGPTARNMQDLLAQFSRPPVHGAAASLLWRTTDPSLEDLRQLREAILNIPNAEMDEVRMANREGWLLGIDQLLQPQIPAGKVLTADQVGEVFRGLGLVLGDDLPMLRNAEASVMDMVSGGELITDDALRDAFRTQLTEAAKAHHSDELRKSVDLVTMLGLSFTPGTPGFNGKLQSLGYTMSRQTLDRQRLRRFVIDSFSRIGIIADETERERLIMLNLRRKRVDDMRIGLGAAIRDVPQNDPRTAFEALGSSTMDQVADFDRQLAAFKAGVLPEGVEDRIIDRAAALEEQMQRAVEAQDYDRINEIREMQQQLDDRALTNPNEPPLDAQPTPEANPQVDYATQLSEAETKAANAHDTLNNAQLALNQAKETAKGAQTTEAIDPTTIPALARHPGTPEDQLSMGEVLIAMREFDVKSKLAAATTEEETKAIQNAFQDITFRRWEGEPKASQKAAREAWADFQRSGSAPQRTTNELDAAQSAFDQAKAAADEADGVVTRLRETGPVHTEAPETPEMSLGAVDDAARQQDPDQLLDWNSANQAYDEAVAALDALDNQDINLDQINNLPASERDEAQAVLMDAAEQERAVAAARVRKLGARRAELWPQEKARLEVARREALAPALQAQVLEGQLMPQRAVTWQWAQVLTKGTPSVDVLRRGRGIPTESMIERGQSVGKIGSTVADITGIRPTASGPFRQYAMPHIEGRLEAQLAPVDEMKASLRQARDDAATERARLQTLADAYTGDPASIEAEMAARQVELDEAQAFLSGVHGARTAAEMTPPLQQQLAENEAAVAEDALGQAMVAERQKWEAAQRVYTDAVTTADRGLAAVRTRIMDTEADIARSEARLERAKALDFQGVNGSDFRQHWQDLQDLNESRRNIVRQGPRRPGEALPPPTREVGGPEMLDDLEDINMIKRLLAGADDQLRQLEGVELSHAEITKRLKDFESGSTGVADVMKFQIRDGWTPLLPRLAQGTDSLYIRNELARAINNLYTAQRKPQTWGLIGDYYTQFFKTYATATPGFHVRNLISGIFMNLVDGVQIRHMARSRGIWKDFLKDPITYFDNAEPEVQRALQAVLGSGAAGVFTDVANKERGRLLNNRLTRWNQRKGSNVEGSLRLGMALDSMAKGQNLGAAMERISRYHFDYNSLSTLDHQARRLIPFWTFISRNIPLQIESMWARPRTYLQYQSFVRNFGETADPLTPAYWLSQGAFTLDENAEGRDSPWYLAPDLPFLRVAEPFIAAAQGDFARATAGSVNINPAIAAPLEAFAFGRKLYTGADIQEEYNEPSTAMQPLMGLLAMLGGTKEGGTSGNQLLDDRYAHVLRSTIPTLNLIERLFNNEGTRTGRQDETALRALGLPVLQLTPELRESTRRTNYYDARDTARSQADLARK